jgi:dTDP-4-dehydrorhamnose 3,5-epimerase
VAIAASPTKGERVELFVGEQNYVLVTVPSMVWNGFKG